MMSTGQDVLKKSKDTVGSWIWYVESFKALHPDITIDYKGLLAQYIKGVSYADAVET